MITHLLEHLQQFDIFITQLFRAHLAADYMGAGGYRLCDLTITCFSVSTIGWIDKIVFLVTCNVTPAPFIRAFPGII
jgi:hypothetical protein